MRRDKDLALFRQQSAGDEPQKSIPQDAGIEARSPRCLEIPSPRILSCPKDPEPKCQKEALEKCTLQT